MKQVDWPSNDGMFGGSRIRLAVPALLAFFKVVWDFPLLDVSGSMMKHSFVPPQCKLETVCDASKAFLGIKREARPQDWVALGAFSSQPTLCSGFVNMVSGYPLLMSALQQMLLLPHEGTCMAAGLDMVSKVLHQSAGAIARCRETHNDAVLIRVITYSDGFDQFPEPALALAEKLKGGGVLLQAFGVGPDRAQVDETFLKRIASTDPEGRPCYRFLADAENVSEAFSLLGAGILVVEE